MAEHGNINYSKNLEPQSHPFYDNIGSYNGPVCLFKKPSILGIQRKVKKRKKKDKSPRVNQHRYPGRVTKPPSVLPRELY